MTRRRITILGATGSVGRSTLDLIERAPERFEIVALTANSDVAALADAALRTHARRAVIADPAVTPPWSTGSPAAASRQPRVLQPSSRQRSPARIGQWRRSSAAPAETGARGARGGQHRRACQQGGAGLRRRAGRRGSNAWRRADCCRSTPNITPSSNVSTMMHLNGFDASSLPPAAARSATRASRTCARRRPQRRSATRSGRWAPKSRSIPPR